MGTCGSRVHNDFDVRSLMYLQAHGIQRPKRFIDQLKAIPKGIEKLERILEGDIIDDSRKNHFDVFFKRFSHSFPQWRDDEYSDVLNLFWTQFNTEQLDHVLIIRKQNSGICILHAVIVLEHYLTAIYTEGKVVSTINLGKYENHTLFGDRLERFLLSNDGGNSLETLRTICRLGDNDLQTLTIPNKVDLDAYNTICELILKRVAKMPALVSSFKASHILNEKAEVSFVDVPSETVAELPRHAMVLLGARRTHSGDYYFLLQNWWESQYFMEMSGEYLCHCQTKITFVTKPFARSDDYDGILYDASFAVTCLDMPEMASSEMSE